MSPRRALAWFLLAVGGSGALAWVRPLGYEAPVWSFLLLGGVIAIASGTWAALLLPAATSGLRWEAARLTSALLPAFAIAIPAEWLVKMLVRGRLAAAPTPEILAATRVEALLYGALLLVGALAWVIHAARTPGARRVMRWSFAILGLVPISVWLTRLDLPMLLGAAAQVLVGSAIIVEAVRPAVRPPITTLSS